MWGRMPSCAAVANRRFTIVLLAAMFLAGCSGGKQTKEEPKPPEYFKADPATAGIVRGSIRFTGKKPVARKIDLDQDPECVRAHGKRIATDDGSSVNANGTLPHVFVYLKTGLEGKAFQPPAEPVNIDQKGCWFHPHVVGIQTGQTLSVSNSDPLTHNIHPMAEKNREWNQSQSQGDPELKRRFARSEVMIPVKCNIHGWMRAFIGVVDHPYFAVTGADGVFEIPNVPPGSYTIAAWHEKFGDQEQAVTLASSASVNAIFTFTGK